MSNSARDQSELELQALHRVIASGARALDLDVVLDRCLEQALAVARAEGAVIYLRDERRNSYRLALLRDIDEALAPTAIDVAPMDDRVNQDHLVIDLREQPTKPLRRMATAAGFTHTLLLTLRVEQRRVGIVGLLFRAAPELAESTLRTLYAISSFEAVAIESARVHRQVELRARLAYVLRDCGERLIDPEADVPSLLLETACTIARADRAFVSQMFDKDGEQWARIVHAVGKDVPLVGMALPTSAPYLAEALKTNAPTVIEDVSALDAESVVGQVARSQGTQAFILITMRQRSRPIGQLFAAAGEPRTYEDAEVEAMQLLATMAAAALERSRKQTEERAQHARIAAILEHLPLVVAVADRAGRILHVNAAGRAFGQRMGSKSGDWRDGMQSTQVFDREGHFIPVEERGMMRAFAGETSASELTLLAANGTRLHILSVSVPLRDSQGEIDAVLTSFQDVTELRDLADAKDRFLSIASHELRSPITSLRATTSLLQLDPSALQDPARRDQLMARIQRQVDRLSTLVERLLDTTRLNAGELPLEYADGDLATLCSDAVEHARLTDREHVYTLDLAQTIEGRWDASRIEQVLTNLINNASRYSPAGSEIVVRARGDGERVSVDVIDQGCGIEAEQLEKLFTPFFRGAGALRHKGGLGLGLYITREIVRRHGGAVRVASEPGRGSNFTVELPRRPKMG